MALLRRVFVKLTLHFLPCPSVGEDRCGSGYLQPLKVAASEPQILPPRSRQRHSIADVQLRAQQQKMCNLRCCCII